MKSNHNIYNCLLIETKPKNLKGLSFTSKFTYKKHEQQKKPIINRNKYIILSAKIPIHMSMWLSYTRMVICIHHIEVFNNILDGHLYKYFDHIFIQVMIKHSKIKWYIFCFSRYINTSIYRHVYNNRTYNNTYKAMGMHHFYVY